MKIKDTLDLCGWGLHNFCIQNHDDLETLQNLGLGRKIFYTGNSNDKHHREVIYDGSTWRISAYMSDVDELRGLITALENATDEEIEALKGRATTTEGNLATLRSEFDALNKALNEDTAGTIDTWNEIQNFVGKYDGSEDLETILSRMNAEIDTKLNKAGGTISGDVQISSSTWAKQLILNNSSSQAAGVRFHVKDAMMGIIYVNDSHKLFFHDGTTANLEILHQGNFANLIGDTYLKTDGSNAMTNGLRLYTFGSGSVNVPTTDGVFIYRGPNTGGVDVSLPNDYTNVLNIGGPNSYSNLQLAWYRSIGVVRLHARVGEEKGYSAWKEIIHEGNYSDLITTLNNNLNVPSITIGGIRLSVENGLLKIEGSAFATGELAAGGAATEGNGGAGGFSLYESWGTSAPTEPLALGANLGYELKTRVEDLELAKTKVTFEPALVSGKPIGTIEIDGNKTNLLAPATYAWSEITGTENVLLKSGGVIKGTGADLLGINRTDGYPTIVFYHNDSTMGRLGFDTSGKPVAQIGGTYYNILTSAGGTIEGNYNVLTIKRNQNNPALIGYSNANGALGWLGFNGERKAVILETDLATYRTILHSGNVGEYKAGDAYKLGGLPASRYLYAIHLDGATHDFKQNFTATNTPFIGRLGDSIQHPNLPDARLRYGNVLHVSVNEKDTAWELVAGHGNNLLMFRSGIWKADGTGTINSNAWKTIAFTDSDITGNAATATKLKNKVSLWGNEFDGTQSLSGTIVLTNDNHIRIKDTLGTDCSVIGMTSGNNLMVGGDMISGSRTHNTYLYGYNIYFRTGANLNAMTITQEGNVEIAGANNAYTRKLAVGVGGAHIIATTTGLPALGAPSSHSLLVGSVHYGLQIGTNTNDEASFIQAQRFNTKAAKALNLNPLGGAVNIASADANTIVNGGFFASKNAAIRGRLWVGADIYDDGESRLNVGGALRICRSEMLDTYLQVKVEDITVSYNAVDTLDGFCSHAFKSHDNTLLYLAGNDGGLSYIDTNFNFRKDVSINGFLNVYGAFGAKGTSSFDGQSTFNALALFNKPIVAKDTLQIGDATLMWDGKKKALIVDKSFASMGEISAGGAGTEGGNTGGGGGTGTITNPDVEYYNPKDNATHTFYHNLPYYDVVVQVYEKNAISGAWDMILADVTIANESNLVTVNFGRKEDVEHKIVVR